MKLRTKLLLGYAGFVLALAVLGAWSARTLSQMSAVSSRIIAENYDSVVAAQNMKESLERQDSAAVFELLGEHDRARRQAADHRGRFDAAFATAAANITEPGETEVVEAIRAGRDDYYRRFDAFLAASGDRTARYFAELEPRFNAVRRECDRLLQLNQEAMRAKADAASQIARRWFYLTLVLALALMAGGVVVEASLANAILGPVRQLTDATTRVAGGDLETSVPVRSADEIGALGAGFNRMAQSIRELRRADYENVSRLKTEFIAAASHELRAPLTNVQMAVHAVLEGFAGPLTPAQLDLLQTGRDDAARLDRVLRRLLDLSRLDAGQTVTARAFVRISTLTTDALDRLRPQAEARGLTLVVDVPPDLPAVDADPGQIGGVITQLVTNAIAATPSGGTITVSAKQGGPAIALAVADSGPGIPRDDLAGIFEPFTRATVTGESGLGLAIARRIVESHGGQLMAASAPGQGSTFTLTLPLADVTQG